MRLIRHLEGQHRDSTSSKQIITTYPNTETRMGDITESTFGRSWTVNLATMSFTFKTQQACIFAMKGFEEGSGEPEMTMTLGQFLTLYGTKEEADAFKKGKDLGRYFGKDRK